MPDQPESNESIPDFQPSLSATEWMMDQRRALGMNVIQGMQGNPDDAARAVQLGTATGVDPSTVYGNLEDFERNHKAALAESLVNSNSFLRSVAEAHPLASTLAQDDWGQLAKVGDAASRMKNESDIQYWVNKINEYNPVSGFARGATEGFQQGFGDAPLRGYWDPTSTYPMQADIELANRLLSGTAGAMAMGIGRAAESIAGTKAGSWITGATTEILDWLGTEAGAKVHMDPVAIRNAVGEGVAKTYIDEARKVAQVAKPFIDAGITPPLGIHPVIDKMWIEQAEADLKNLQELQSESAKSTLRERAPNIFEQAIGRQLPQTVGVKAEAIRKLYGDKPIQIGDGLLGDAGNVAEQLILAEAHGGDVEIPMAKWLSRVDPETQKALADDIRLRPQAPTINEAKEIQERADRLKEAEESAQKEAEPERITGAAIRAGDQIFSGPVHSSAWANAADAGIDMSKLAPDDVDGFVTSAGRYVSREEAAEIATKARQTARPTKRLESGQLTPGYWTPIQDRVVPTPTAGEAQPTFEEWLKSKGIPEDDPDIDLRREEYEESLTAQQKEPAKGTIEFESAGATRRRDVVPTQSSDTLDLARTSVGTRTSLDWLHLPARSGLGGAESIVPTDTARPTTFKDGVTGKAYKSIGSFAADEGLAKIQTENIHSPVIKATMDFFGDVLHRLAGDTMVHVVSDADMNRLEKEISDKFNIKYSANAFYDPVSHHVVIRDSIANGSKHGHEYAAGALTEEIAHAATVREMRNDKALYNRISMLRQHTIDWLTQNNTDRLNYHKYELSNNEEFVAWAWKSDQRFRDTLSKIPVSPTMRRTFGFGLQGLATAWDVFRELYRKLLTNIAGKAPPESVLDALLRMGPEFERSNALMRIRKGEPEQLGPKAPTPTIDPILERIKAYGMNAKRAENYRKLVEKSNAEDAKWQLQQGEKRERKLQSDQWKADTAQMRQDVEVDLKRRPDHAADRLLRLGEFSGQKVQRVSLDKADLTPEQIASLPEGYFKLKNKVTAQALANAVGFTTPKQLIESLAKLHANREAAGMNPAEYLKSLIESETQRQMQLVHGDLEQNIMHDAQEHVLGASSLDVTHEELIALAERAGVKALDKEGIKAAAKAEFDKQMIENISREKYQAAAQKHAQAVEDELTKGDKADARDALQRKGQQVVALHLAKFAKDLEKRLKADEKLRKTLAKTEPSGIDPEYAVWAQDILSRTGTFVKRTLQGMERQKDLVSDSGSLREFVDQVNSASNIWQDENSGGFSLPVPDFLMDPNYRKPVSKMTVAEFDSVATALKTINGIGRDIRSFVVKGEKVALEDVQNGLIERMKAFYRDREVDPAKAHAFQQIGTWLLNPETWFNKLDLFDPRGPFNQLLIRPVVEGSYESLAFRKEMAKDWKAVATFKDANKTLPDSPLMWKGRPIPMTKENAYVILANMGNELQRKKLAGGYGVKDVQDIWNWLGNVLTKEDMDRQAKEVIASQETPPPPSGTTRFFHGGTNPTSGGGRWVTTDPVYARDFRTHGGRKNEVHYVDIPKDDPTEVGARAWDELDERAQTNMVGHYNHVEVPEHWAQQMRPYVEAGTVPIRRAGVSIGEFWEKWFGRAEEMYAKLHGWIPDRIELGQVQTPWGMYNEWYHPLIKDPAKFVEGGKIGDIFDDSGYFRPAPGNVYAKKRTGAIYPIDLTFRGVVARAEQIANDIAMRPPITQVSKIILSSKFKQAMTAYMGPAYQKAIEPWLRDSAGQYRRPDIDGNLEKLINGLRQNLSTLMIGANLGTFFKHTPTALAFSVKEVGGKDFLGSFLHMFYETDTGQARWKFAFEHSQELPNRLHFARESMGSINEDIFKRINWDSKFFRARDIIQSIGAAPVAMGDMLSAVPMWDAKYRQLRAEDIPHGDAVYEADQAVRRTHGSTIVANRAALLRKGGLWGFITPFYNFFNNALQRNYEYGWQAKLSMEGRTLPEMTGFEQAEFKRGFHAVPGILGGLLIYGIVPSLIEQVVDPLPRDKKESSWWYWSKSLLHAPVSMIPGVRDVVNGLMAGRETDVGLFGSAGNDISEPFRTNWIRNPDKAFRGVVDMVGTATGLTFHSEGNLGEYIINLERGKEHTPKGIGDVVSILRHGTLKEKRR